MRFLKARNYLFRVVLLNNIWFWIILVTRVWEFYLSGTVPYYSFQPFLVPASNLFNFKSFVHYFPSLQLDLKYKTSPVKMKNNQASIRPDFLFMQSNRVQLLPRFWKVRDKSFITHLIYKEIDIMYCIESLRSLTSIIAC